MPYSTTWAGVGNLSESKINSHLMNQSVIQCTSTTRPNPSVEGMLIYETDTKAFAGCSAGGSPGSWVYLAETAWVDLSNIATTPVQFSLSWSNTTIQELRWRWTNGMVDLFVKISAGSGTTGTSSLITMDGFTMPTPSINGIPAGSFHYYASSPNINYAGTVNVLNNAGTPRFNFVVTGSNNALGASPSFTYGSADVLLFQARYRAS